MRRNQSWWKEGTIYHVYARSFADSDGDGVGDLPGITGKLDYLSWLGVDAVWISPIYPSPMADFGYDVSDYTDVDPTFGSLDDFHGLVAEAHRLGMRVVLDFVPNHTSSEHPWFVESRSSREDPRRGWYHWRDPKPDGSPPNNWRGVADFGTAGSAWTWDEHSAQYFLATFSPSQPDLNWGNPEVRRAIYEAMRFWLSRGADGFRLDMADFLGKDALLRDEAPLDDGWGMYEYLTRAKYQLNRPENLQYAREMRRVADEHGEDRVLVGETNYHLPVDRLAALGAPGLLDLAGNFRLTFLPFEAATMRAFVDEYDAACAAAGAWPNWCLGNHDTARVISRLGPEPARLAAVLLLTLRGTPFLYYGDEIGMPTVEVPPEKRRDPWAHPSTGAGRDGARTPMQWDASPNAGFSETEPWLPVDPGHRSASVAAQIGDPSSALGLYRRLLRLRRDAPALSSGDYASLPAPEGCFLFARSLGDERALVVLNLSGGERAVPLPGAGVGATVRLSTRPDREGEAVGGSVRLAAREGLVLTSCP